jgi:hypothetical protein
MLDDGLYSWHSAIGAPALADWNTHRYGPRQERARMELDVISNVVVDMVDTTCPCQCAGWMQMPTYYFSGLRWS